VARAHCVASVPAVRVAPRGIRIAPSKATSNSPIARRVAFRLATSDHVERIVLNTQPFREPSRPLEGRWHRFTTVRPQSRTTPVVAKAIAGPATVSEKAAFGEGRARPL
jgi:hypothetical protein